MTQKIHLKCIHTCIYINRTKQHHMHFNVPLEVNLAGLPDFLLIFSLFLDSMMSQKISFKTFLVIKTGEQYNFESC